MDAARWLANHGRVHDHNNGVVGVGIDTVSIDVGTTVKNEAHVILHGHNIYALENVANTDKVGERGRVDNGGTPM